MSDALNPDPALDHLFALALQPAGRRDLGHRGFNRRFVAFLAADDLALGAVADRTRVALIAFLAGSASGDTPECVHGIGVGTSRLPTRWGFESATRGAFGWTSIHESARADFRDCTRVQRLTEADSCCPIIFRDVADDLLEIILAPLRENYFPAHAPSCCRS